MAVTLSVKNVPDELADKLRERAAENHRSMQGELLSILENALSQRRSLSPAEVWALGKDLVIQPASESAEIVREMRDGRRRS